jgi:hydrogenase maturation protein HypF
MKLEAAALQGRDVISLEPEIHGGIIDTRCLLLKLLEEMDRFRRADIACSAQSYLARSLAQLAIQEAEELGVQVIGFTGGVAYNGHMVATVRRMVESHGLSFVTNIQVPPGDGGVSFGQVVATAMILGRWVR